MAFFIGGKYRKVKHKARSGKCQKLFDSSLDFFHSPEIAAARTVGKGAACAEFGGHVFAANFRVTIFFKLAASCYFKSGCLGRQDVKGNLTFEKAKSLSTHYFLFGLPPIVKSRKDDTKLKIHSTTHFFQNPKTSDGHGSVNDFDNGRSAFQEKCRGIIELTNLSPR